MLGKYAKYVKVTNEMRSAHLIPNSVA